MVDDQVEVEVFEKVRRSEPSDARARTELHLGQLGRVGREADDAAL